MTNQSELEANTCNRRQARKRACRQDRIGFGFNSDWLRKWREFLSQSESEVKLNQSKREFTFDSPLKTAPCPVLTRLHFVVLPEDIKDEMKLNANITKLLSEAKTKFSDDEHEVKT